MAILRQRTLRLLPKTKPSKKMMNHLPNRKKLLMLRTPPLPPRINQLKHQMARLLLRKKISLIRIPRLLTTPPAVLRKPTRSPQ